MNSDDQSERNSQAIMYLQNYISKLKMRIKDLEENDIKTIEDRITSLKVLKSEAEKAPASRKKEIKKLIVSIIGALIVTTISGMVIFSNPFGIISVIMILSILVSNLNVLSSLGEISYLSKIIKNSDIDKIEEALNINYNSLEKTNSIIKQIEKEIVKNKQFVSELVRETKIIRISNNQGMKEENESDKNFQFVKKNKIINLTKRDR